MRLPPEPSLRASPRRAQRHAQRTRRGLRALVAAGMAALLMLAALPLARATEVLTLRQALWMPADAQGQPDAAQARTVRLPDDLAARGADRLPSFYRLDVTLPQRPAETQALYLEGVKANLVLRVNGELAADAGDAPALPEGGWKRARYFEVAPALLHAGRNELLLQVAPPRAAVVSSVVFGPRDAVQPRFVRKLLATAVGPLVISAIVLVAALSVLLIWAYRRDETQFAYFGIGGLLWGGHTLWTLLPHPPLPPPHEAVWWNSVYMAFVGLLVMFCVRFTGQVWRRFERGVWLFIAAGPLALYAAAALGELPTAALWWRALGICLVLSALVIVARYAWRRHDVESALLLLTGGVSALFAIHDWRAHGDATQVNPTVLVPYAGLMFVVLMTWILTRRMVLAYGVMEQAKAQLAARVAEKTDELERNYQLLRDAERRQSALEERRGILQDMHDGIGTQLMVSMRSLEHGDMTPREAATVMRDCIDELRLTIDALDQAEGDIAAILAHLRYRLGDKLRHAGVDVDWQVREVPHMRRLEGAAGRELMRIVQEALNNILRHSGASRVTFETGLDAAGGCAFVSIRDNGCGLRDQTAEGSGRGLRHMRQRAERIGAQLQLRGLSPGTEVRLEIALDPA